MTFAPRGETLGHMIFELQLYGTALPDIWYSFEAETHEQAAEKWMAVGAGYGGYDEPFDVLVRAVGSQYAALVRLELVPRATVKVAALPTRRPSRPLPSP